MECDDNQNESFYSFLLLFFCQYMGKVDLAPFSDFFQTCDENFMSDVLDLLKTPQKSLLSYSQLLKFKTFGRPAKVHFIDQNLANKLKIAFCSLQNPEENFMLKICKKCSDYSTSRKHKGLCCFHLIFTLEVMKNLVCRSENCPLYNVVEVSKFADQFNYNFELHLLFEILESKKKQHGGATISYYNKIQGCLISVYSYFILRKKKKECPECGSKSLETQSFLGVDIKTHLKSLFFLSLSYRALLSKNLKFDIMEFILSIPFAFKSTELLNENHKDLLDYYFVITGLITENTREEEENFFFLNDAISNRGSKQSQWFLVNEEMRFDWTTMWKFIISKQHAPIFLCYSLEKFDSISFTKIKIESLGDLHDLRNYKLMKGCEDYDYYQFE